MNFLTKFHEDRTVNVASRVLTRFYYSHIRKNAPPLGSHVFQAKFHEDRKINVDSRVLTMKKAPPSGSHVFQQTCIIFKLVQDIIWMNLLTKFNEDQTINVSSRVFTRFYYSHLRKNAPPHGIHVFQANVTIFELNRHIQKRHVLAKFHEDWTKNVTLRKTALPPGGHAKIVTSRVFTSPPSGGHVFQHTGTIFQLNQHII
ncbi:hypothetical protein DPMN_024206 [Dreissena polymorpha]|uniref:Uncharacterized protein n=1 Tax=Dreissena polymorpha TaxID=45954 RepID=A0A9D4LP43_DREPO|nr:hypothetical protein DPMN_024206 [Dreissena polymorpha]